MRPLTAAIELAPTVDRPHAVFLTDSPFVRTRVRQPTLESAPIDLASAIGGVRRLPQVRYASVRSENAIYLFRQALHSA